MLYAILESTKGLAKNLGGVGVVFWLVFWVVLRCFNFVNRRYKHEIGSLKVNMIKSKYRTLQLDLSRASSGLGGWDGWG